MNKTFKEEISLGSSNIFVYIMSLSNLLYCIVLNKLLKKWIVSSHTAEIDNKLKKYKIKKVIVILS